ncbi:MAG: methyltransferase domain-containing protein [Pseudonocardia sp.]
MSPDWRARLDAMVDHLLDAGDLTSAPWREAFSAVPRHLFVPTVLVLDGGGSTVLSATDPAQRDIWLDLVYSDESLITQHREHPTMTTTGDQPLLISTSSSTMPSLMARMLEVLDVHDGHRVLEIGTGTGYNAALMCQRLGADHVVSIDIDPELVAAARTHLAELGHHPVLIAGDGTAGAAAHGRYDRIIATAAVADIPPAWIEQLAPGGKILANLRGDLAGATLCLLSKDPDDDVVTGAVLPLGGHFMWLRPELTSPLRAPEPAWVRSSRTAAHTKTPLDPAGLADDHDFRFLLQLHLRGARGLRRGQVRDPRTHDTRAGHTIETLDGSYAEVIAEPEHDGHHLVLQSGPRRLWDSVETAHRLWHHLGRPHPGQFAVVASPTAQYIHYDPDDTNNWYRWPLPLV